MGSDKGDGLALAQPAIGGAGVNVEIVDAGDGLNAPFGRCVEEWGIIQCSRDHRAGDIGQSSNSIKRLHRLLAYGGFLRGRLHPLQLVAL